SKERLEEIKRDYTGVTHYTQHVLSSDDIHWLIEQAERAMKNAQDLEDMDRQLYATQQQLRHYQDVIKKAENVLSQYGVPIGVAKQNALSYLQQSVEELK